MYIRTISALYFFLSLLVSSCCSASQASSQALILEREELNDKMAINIAHSPAYQTLHILSLSNNKIGDEGVSILSQNLTNLTSLNLANNLFSNESVLLIAKHLLGLDKLNLSYSRIEDSGAEAISQRLTRLKDLTLVASGLTPFSCRSIAEHLTNLVSLNLALNTFDTEGMHGLINTPHLFLKSLNLAHSSIRTLDVVLLASCSWLTNLRELVLSHNYELGSTGINFIVSRLIYLENLDLSHTNIQDETTHLIGKHLTQLCFLELGHNNITDKGAISLAASSFSHLKFLSLIFNPLEEQGKEALRKMKEARQGVTILY